MTGPPALDAPPAEGPLARRVRRLVRSASFAAYVDQGEVSLGNLLTQIVLARLLVPADYGVVTLLIGAILAVRALLAATVTYPVTVWSATASETETRRQAGQALAATAMWAVPGVAVIGVVCLVLDRASLWPFAAAALVAGLLQETIRRVLFARLRFAAAIVGDAVSYPGQAVALAVVVRATTALPAVFATMAVTSALALVVQVVQVRPAWPAAPRRWALGALGFGRWMLGTNVLQPLTIQLFPWLLAGFYGTEATAELQAISTLLGVSNPVMATSSNLVVPIAARATVEGEERVRGLVWRIGAQSFALLAPFYAVMLLVPTLLLRLVFGANSSYVSLGGEMRLLTVAYMLMLGLNILGNYFVGIGRSKVTFMAQVAGVVVAVTVGVALVWRFGVAGACLAVAASTGVQVAWLWRLWRAPVPDPLPAGDGSPGPADGFEPDTSDADADAGAASGTEPADVRMEAPDGPADVPVDEQAAADDRG